MEIEDIERIVSSYAAAGRRCAEGRLDGIEVMVSSHLPGQFLSLSANRREDEYGGSLENRMRFPLEIFDAVRSVWPDRKPISVRISATDWAPGGVAPRPEARVEQAEGDPMRRLRIEQAHGAERDPLAEAHAISAGIMAPSGPSSSARAQRMSPRSSGR